MFARSARGEPAALEGATPQQPDGAMQAFVSPGPCAVSDSRVWTSAQGARRIRTSLPIRAAAGVEDALSSRSLRTEELTWLYWYTPGSH
jgi:hypothetical protein